MFVEFGKGGAGGCLTSGSPAGEHVLIRLASRAREEWVDEFRIIEVYFVGIDARLVRIARAFWQCG